MFRSTKAAPNLFQVGLFESAHCNKVCIIESDLITVVTIAKPSLRSFCDGDFGRWSLNIDITKYGQ